jgi:HSP20 family protein
LVTRPGRRYSDEGVSQLRAELERLVQEVLAASETTQRSGWTPALDVLDTGTSLVVQLEIAGLAPADVRIEIEGTTVRIKGRRRLTCPVPGRVRFHCLERQEGKFVRQVEVLEPVDFRNARATLTDGLLRLELPKVEERRRRLQVVDVVEVAPDAAGVAGDAPSSSAPAAEEPRP